MKPRSRTWGNAGRNGGEYYTPRPLIRAMIQVVKPKVGDRIYDGAVGSAGFLCEAFEYLKAKQGLTTKDLELLHTRTFYGKEKKVPRLRHRDNEHDPAWDRGAEHPAHQHAGGEPRRHPGEGPLRRGAGESALRLSGGADAAAALRLVGLPVLCAEPARVLRAAGVNYYR